jgi:hypothetical protein
MQPLTTGTQEYLSFIPQATDARLSLQGQGAYFVVALGLVNGPAAANGATISTIDDPPLGMNKGTYATTLIYLDNSLIAAI